MGSDRATFSGSASVGWIPSMTWSARLTVQRDLLILDVFPVGTYTFTPDQVVAFESSPLFIWQRIRIRHNIASYPERIIFDRGILEVAPVVRGIAETGFAPKASRDSMPARDGLPVRWGIVAAVMLLWVGLFILLMTDPPRSHGFPHERGTIALAGMGLLFAGAAAVRCSEKLQRVFLKRERSGDEIKAWLYLLMLSTGLPLLAIGATRFIAS